jgi:hypothetical protein
VRGRGVEAEAEAAAAGGARAGAIGRIERIRHQDRRPAVAGADITRGGDGGEEQAFAAAVEHQHLGLGIDGARQVESARQPIGDRAAERLDPPGHRIAAELGDVLGQHRADEVGHGMLGLADRKRNQRLAWLMRGQKLVQPDKGRAFVGGASAGLGRTG